MLALALLSGLAFFAAGHFKPRRPSIPYGSRALLTGALYMFGRIHQWWVVATTFGVCVLAVGMTQSFLVALIILHRTSCIILRIRVGLKPQPPRLAPFAWTLYLTETEQKKTLEESLLVPRQREQ